MPESERKAPDEFSRSKRKREVEALQDIGAKLLTLTKNQLRSIPMSELLLEAVEHGQTLKTNEAKRRHLQYIGKLMRSVEIEPIQLALKIIQAAQQGVTKQFQEVEIWRDKLIADNNDDLQNFINNHPTVDRQQLRQLIRKAQRDQAANKNTGGSKELFRYLKELMESEI